MFMKYDLMGGRRWRPGHRRPAWTGLLGEIFAVRQCARAGTLRDAGMALKASRKPIKLWGLAAARLTQQRPDDINPTSAQPALA